MPREQLPRPSPESHQEGRGTFDRILINLGLLLTLGVLLSFWVIFYTGWFPILGGLLGLGGAFAWAAFLANVISGETKNHLQYLFETKILGGRWTRSILVVVFLLAALLLPTMTSTLVLQSGTEDPEREVRIFRPRESTDSNAEAIYHDTLEPGERKTVLLFRSLGSPQVKVKLSGLPSAHLDLPLLRRVSLTSPASFLKRPVVLIRPSVYLSDLAQEFDFRLLVKRGHEVLLNLYPYDGRAVWLGCESDVAIPLHRLNLWRFELSRQDFSELALSRWLPPLAEPQIHLNQQDELEVSIAKPNEPPYVGPIVFTVHDNLNAADFPQEIVLDGSL